MKTTSQGVTLVAVTDIFGGAWLVRQDQLEAPEPDQLTLYTPQGNLADRVTLHRSHLGEVEPGVAAVWKLPVYAGHIGDDWEKDEEDPPAFYLIAPTPYQLRWAWENYADGDRFALYCGTFKCPQCGQPRVLTTETVPAGRILRYHCYACNQAGIFHEETHPRK